MAAKPGGYWRCGGEPASTEVRFRRMRAEDHHPRKKMENNLTADTQLALAA